MAKKKIRKNAAKKVKEEPTWDEIGKAIGKKIEKASKDGEFNCRSWDFRNKVHCHGGGGFYFLGFIGALVYYVTTAPSFWMAKKAMIPIRQNGNLNMLKIK